MGFGSGDLKWGAWMEWAPVFGLATMAAVCYLCSTPALMRLSAGQEEERGGGVEESGGGVGEEGRRGRALHTYLTHRSHLFSRQTAKLLLKTHSHVRARAHIQSLANEFISFL